MTREQLLSLRPGARLRMTEHGRTQFPTVADRPATFVRLVRHRKIRPVGQCIVVQVGGAKVASRWHHSFWEPIEP
jgi:hypothetical protein